jgi:hypothetical protein
MVKGVKKCCISSAVDGTDNDMLRNDAEEDGSVRSECEETVTLIGKCRSNLTCLVY